MLKVLGGCGELHNVINSIFQDGIKSGRNELGAEGDAFLLAEALGWKGEKGWRDKSGYDKVILKIVDVTENFIRVRIRPASEFQQGAFRVIDIDPGKGIRATIGRPKGKTTTDTQNYLFARAKGWTASSAEKWVRDHGKTPR